MFALRGIAVSLTFFVLLYCLLSALIVVSWRAMRWLPVTQRSLASFLFALRVLPLAASIVITFAFVVPSFQLLEPRSIDEGIGEMTLAFGICALLLIVFGCLRVIAAQTKTSRVTARWIEGASPLNSNSNDSNDSNSRLMAFRSCGEAPPLTLVGVRNPRVLVSQSAIELLSSEELHIALQHELAHMQSRDNLKKLIFRFCPFPGMSKLESAWSQAAEMAADDSAVANLDNAIDLAAALIKLSRLVSMEVAPVCTIGFVTGCLSLRVARLLAWNEARKVESEKIIFTYAIPPVLVLLLCLFVTYSPLLALTHEATEWLVR
jgi:Zn-dependent protease with chaperone function